ncbi:type III polyketide synthase [Microbacterium esteraromaticum]|uniref:Type III polyketide synthase n=1 Tax=Microbacterium esteraromaticum TaxID=57043 RepID=A0A939DYR4_9MICO|nr:type III polyketide synthase [Microbacterium esteraromaticum]MBN8206488.1 type III polyketide synthase [Microbacterium esteraromaticum]MBN8416643.1 type III polyketide synthase [Microbacterium esteraromaticum]
MRPHVQLRSLQTLVPDVPLEQGAVRDVFAGQPGISRLTKRLVTASFDGSGIETRHTVLTELDLTADAPDPQFYDRESGALLVPGTKARNETYAREADRLFVAAAQGAIAADPDITASDVTHVVTVSCTGFHAPGPDYAIVRGLGLSDAVQRYHLGFMGCYAAMPALRAATQFCLADPTAVVLVVSVELCTLHLRSSDDPDTIIASSLFSDGAAAALVTARSFEADVPAFSLDGFHTAIVPDGKDDMAWTIGDSGFEMVLSTAVPQLIGENIDEALRPLWAAEDALVEAFDDGRIGAAVQHWAIHPGGRSILDRVQSRLQLSDGQLHPAREVLRTCGNMSSATVLFVLQRILDDPDALAGQRVAAMAFGPGLTAESAMLTVIGGTGGG